VPDIVPTLEANAAAACGVGVWLLLRARKPATEKDRRLEVALLVRRVDDPLATSVASRDTSPHTDRLRRCSAVIAQVESLTTSERGGGG
jgi:hypothetical protein